MKQLFIPFIFSVIISSIFIYLEISVSLILISKLFEISLVVSSILFGVLGIWLSTVYNDSLKVYLRNDSSIDDLKSVNNEIKRLLYPLFFSFISVSCSLLYFTSLLFVDEIKTINFNHSYLKTLAVFIYIFITFFQINFLTIIFKPLIEVFTSILSETNYKNLKDNIFNSSKKNLK